MATHIAYTTPLGQKVKAFMDRHEMTPAQFSRHAGISPGSHWLAYLVDGTLSNNSTARDLPKVAAAIDYPPTPGNSGGTRPRNLVAPFISAEDRQRLALSAAKNGRSPAAELTALIEANC